MYIDIGKITKWDASCHTGTIHSEATSKDYLIQKSSFGRVPREPIPGDIVIIDKLVSKGFPLRVEKARIRGLETKESSGTLWAFIIILIVLLAGGFLVWKLGKPSLDKLPIVRTTTPKTLEAPNLLHEGEK